MSYITITKDHLGWIVRNDSWSGKQVLYWILVSFGENVFFACAMMPSGMDYNSMDFIYDSFKVRDKWSFHPPTKESMEVVKRWTLMRGDVL